MELDVIHTEGLITNIVVQGDSNHKEREQYFEIPTILHHEWSGNPSAPEFA